MFNTIFLQTSTPAWPGPTGTNMDRFTIFNFQCILVQVCKIILAGCRVSKRMTVVINVQQFSLALRAAVIRPRPYLDLGHIE